MKTLFIGIKHWDEVYTSFIDVCSTDKTLVEDNLKSWEIVEHNMGNDASTEITSVEVSDELIKCLDIAFDEGVFVALHFIVEIEAINEKGEPIQVKNPSFDEYHVRVKRVLERINSSQYVKLREERPVSNPLEDNVQECRYLKRDV
jgi:hypothetical protein